VSNLPQKPLASGTTEMTFPLETAHCAIRIVDSVDDG
jgi:hypothetical protein